MRSTQAMSAVEDRGYGSAVAIDGLTKHFGKRVAVDGLSLEVPVGVVAGFIGPNGAGKTTTMAMLLGLVAPTAGSGTVLGHSLGTLLPPISGAWERSWNHRPSGPGSPGPRTSGSSRPSPVMTLPRSHTCWTW